MHLLLPRGRFRRTQKCDFRSFFRERWVKLQFFLNFDEIWNLSVETVQSLGCRRVQKKITFISMHAPCILSYGYFSGLSNSIWPLHAWQCHPTIASLMHAWLVTSKFRTDPHFNSKLVFEISFSIRGDLPAVKCAFWWPPLFPKEEDIERKKLQHKTNSRSIWSNPTVKIKKISIRPHHRFFHQGRLQVAIVCSSPGFKICRCSISRRYCPSCLQVQHAAAKWWLDSGHMAYDVAPHTALD